MASRSFYDPDGLGTVTSMLNGSGGAIASYVYDTFGNATATAGSLVNRFRNTGRELDSETGLYYYRARYYDTAVGRFISEDPNDRSALDESPFSLYTYTKNQAVNFVDPLGLYGIKPGVPSPSPALDALLKCIESNTGLILWVTSTSEPIPQHPPGTPHRRGVAVDIRYQPGNAAKILCAAKACGAGYGLDEAKHPSPHSTGNHIHLQIPPGTKGGHGDLPPKTKCEPPPGGTCGQ